VKLDKVGKQLRRDVAANPKKTIVLGLMALVALYFWAPLVWRWFVPEGGRKPLKDQTLALILTDDPLEPTQQAKGRPGGKFRWEKIRQLIREDQRMISAAYDPAWSDPFADRTILQPGNGVAGSLHTTGPETTPREAGLVLTSVWISPRQRTATINGEIYLQNDIVAGSGTSTRTAGVEYRVVQISQQGVELERNGRTYLLELQKPKLAPGDQIKRVNARPNDR
jgi:hypothetical protein